METQRKLQYLREYFSPISRSEQEHTIMFFTVHLGVSANWVCLIEQVSNRDTAAITVSSSGKKSYGLYQIPSKWCKEGKKGGDCNIACESLLDDDIRDDTECALTIFHREGFKYWPKWTSRCKNNIDFITKEIYKCPGMTNRRRLSPGTELPSEKLKIRKKQTKNGIDRRIGN